MSFDENGMELPSTSRGTAGEIDAADPLSQIPWGRNREISETKPIHSA